jgi:hypothetical protein
MALTDTTCNNAKCPPDKVCLRLGDSGGLYLEVVPTGGKLWRWKYRYGGKEKRLALGSYPRLQLPGPSRIYVQAADGKSTGCSSTCPYQLVQGRACELLGQARVHAHRGRLGLSRLTVSSNGHMLSSKKVHLY